MGKITFLTRTILIVFFLLGSSLTFLTATNSNSADITISGDVDNVSCSNGNDGAINTTISGGVGNYIITWAGTSQTTEDISGLTAGSYTITVTDAENNSASKVFTVTQPDPLQLTASTTTAVTCNGVSDGSITAGNVTGGTTPYQYYLNNTSYGSSTTITGLSSGDYVLKIVDANNCAIEQTLTISQPDVLAMEAPSSTAVSCNAGEDGKITAGNVTGGNGGYLYSIDGTAFISSNTFENLKAGAYTITVKDSKGCTASKTISVTEPMVLTMATGTATSTSCFGGSDGIITAGTVTGGNGSYLYSIDGNNFTSSNTFQNLTAQTYTLTVKDSKGCSANETITVSEPELLVSGAHLFTDVSCFGTNDGAITIGEVSGGIGNYTYMITGKPYQTTKSFSGLTPGTYTITIKDGNNCVLEEDVVIKEPSELSMTEDLIITPVSCYGGNDGSVTAGTVSGGNGGYLYSIDNVTFTSGKTFSGLSSGSHTIFVKDINNCVLQRSVTVAEPLVLNAKVTATNINCFEGADGTIVLSGATGGSGSYQYSIDGANWQDSSSFTTLIAGTYPVYIRDTAQNSCELLLKEIQLTQPAAALATTVSTTRTTTYGTSTGSATATPTGGTGIYFYEWRKAGETTILTTTQTVANIAAGNYELTVRDSNGCTVTLPFTIIDKVKASIFSSSLCLTQHDYLRTSTFQVDLEEIAGGVGSPANFIYTWNFGTDASITSGTGTGEYTLTWGNFGDKVISLTITDEAGVSEIYNYDHYVGACFEGCGETENFELDIYNFFIGDKDGNKLTGYNCEETTEKYLWIDITKNANGYSLNAELYYAVNDGEQTYSRKAVGCFEEIMGTSGNKNIYKPIPLGLFRLFPVQETGEEAGMITWKCGETFKVEQILLRWTNQENRGCGEGTKPMCYGPDYPITVNTPLMVTATPANVLCKGTNSGSLIIHATGGYLPYQYRISGPKTVVYQDGNEFYDLPAGNYSYDVKDARGIVTSGTVTIIEPSTVISATISGQNPLCYGEAGQATVISTGGTPFIDGEGNSYYEYLWNSGQTTATATDLLDGLYTVTVRDANGCEVLETIEILQPEQLTIAETGEDIVYNCGFRFAELWANTPERGIGTWTIISAENGGVISEPNNPISSFTGNAGVHTLRWTIANEDGTCESYSEVNVTFSEECSTLDFDGIDDYVYFDDTYGLTTGAFTIEAWVKPNALGGVKTVLSKRNSLNLAEGGYDLIINNGSPTFRWGGSGSVSTSFKINTDRWYHLAVIFENGQVKLYVDGIKLATATATNPKAVTHPFLVGAMFKDNKQDKPQNLFNGWIEEVRVWDTTLTEEQLRFLMNQRVKRSSVPLRGTVLPLNVPGTLQWTNLLGYYRMIGETVVDGKTLDEADNKVDGELRNITTTQQNTAPLPYISAADSEWALKSTWLRPEVWDYPNSKGINGTPIDWNIARISNNISSGAKDITMLGLLSESNKLTVTNPNENPDEKNSGHGLTITHYLQLNGVIDLIGESQLVQTDIANTQTKQTITSVLEESSTGYIERDQQGTANSFNYNYWTSPVSLQGAANNSTYSIASVMLDGTTSSSPKGLSFGGWHEFADGPYSSPRKVSNYWLHKFRGTVNIYSEWVHIGSTGVLNAGEGYTMKGTSGQAAIEDRQNYVFKGKPNNGNINLAIAKDQNYLLGNPYPSSININKFILDNLKDVEGGTSSANVFNGAVYFWDHFAGGDTHILLEYIGGYATRNLIDGVPAISNDARVNANDAKGSKIPGLYIPVAQGFFINSSGVDATVSVVGGDVRFKNSQREFIRESTGNTGNSLFLRPEEHTKQNQKADTRPKIRLDFKSPKGYHRQILVGVDASTSSGFDLGFDAPLNDYILEDMFWLIGTGEYVIQGVPDFNIKRILPLGIRIEKEGDFSIEINELENIADDVDIYLRDNAEKTFHDLKKSKFEGIISSGNFNDRYEIVFQKEEETENTVEPGDQEGEVDSPDPDNGEEIVEEKFETAPEVFFIEGNMELLVKNPELHKINNLTLYSLSGQIVQDYGQVATEKEVTLPVRGFSSSVYVVKMYTDKGVIIKKLIINN